MTQKKLLIGTAISWINIGFLYLMYLLKIEFILLGVYRELTIIPSYIAGVIIPIILLIKFLRSLIKAQV